MPIKKNTLKTKKAKKNKFNKESFDISLDFKNSKDFKFLIIVESPAKAHSLTGYLGNEYKIVASVGHVIDLPKSKLSVDIENNFEPHYTVIKGKAKIVNGIKKLAESAEKIYLATDPDREGEVISWHFSRIFKIPPEELCRITFHEITKNAVLAAIKNPNRINENLVNAQQARRILDRIVGYLITPILWKKIKGGTSAGRVQSVVMKMIIDREEEIENFLIEEYFTVEAKLSSIHDKTSFFTAKLYGEIDKKFEVIKNKEFAEEIKNYTNEGEFVAQNVKKGKKNKNPTPPFATHTLQQEASRKLGFSPRKTMSIAQQLYDGTQIGNIYTGLITYIRTDSLRLSKEFCDSTLEFIKQKYGKDYIPITPNIFKGKKSIQDAHEAIRPTDIKREPDKIKDYLSSEQYHLYRLIWTRTLASQMVSAIYNTVQIDVTCGKYLFKASAQSLSFDGFMKVYVEGVDFEKQEDQKIDKISDISNGDILIKKEVEVFNHFTQPPPRFSEASIIKQMEEKGIGRPSTYSPTISTILERGYITQEKKILIPTSLGKTVNNIMKDNFKDIVDVNFTANMESKLDEIESGGKEWKHLLLEFYEGFKIDLENAKNNIAKVEIDYEMSDTECDKCGKKMVYKMGRFGWFLACPGYPECKNTKPIVEDSGVICQKCGSRIVIRKSSKFKKKYYVCEKRPECDFISWDKPTEEKCPKCGDVILEKTTYKDGKLLIKKVCYNGDCD